MPTDTTSTKAVSTFSLNARLLAIIGRRIPAIFDIIPRGPLDPATGIALNPAISVALNPQPLPPQQLGGAVAAEFIRAAWFADRFGLDMTKVFTDLDDWCGTPPRRPWKRPPWWPPKWGFEEPEPSPANPNDPHPEPWFIDFHIGFASRVAGALVEAQGTKFGETLNKAFERSIAVLQKVG